MNKWISWQKVLQGRLEWKDTIWMSCCFSAETRCINGLWSMLHRSSGIILWLMDGESFTENKVCVYGQENIGIR